MQMQTGRLQGKLEELGLDDILHIIGVSRRTGILTLSSQGGTAVLHFADGLLVRAASSTCRQYLGELLVQNGVVSSKIIQQALLIQQQSRPRQPIGAILHQQFQVDLQVIETTVRQQINLVLQSLVSWAVGVFDFSSLAMVETVDAAYLDPEQLVIELHEVETEDSANSAAAKLQDVGAAAVCISAPDDAVPVSLHESGLPVMVIADDDREFAERLAQLFGSEYETIVCFFAEEAAAAVSQSQGAVSGVTVLADLIMPKADGSGVLAGLELVRRLHEQGLSVSIIAMTDFSFTNATEQLATWGYPLLMKPRRGSGADEMYTAFLEHLRPLLEKDRLSGGR